MRKIFLTHPRQMKKIISFVVIFSLCTIVLPARAFAPAAVALLNPAVLGSVVVAGGVISGTAAHYAPSVYQAGQVAIDQAGNFSRTLYQAEKFLVASGAEYVVGRLEQLGVSIGSAGSTVHEWIKSNPSSVPVIAAAQSSANRTPSWTPAIGNSVPYGTPDTGVLHDITSLGPLFVATYTAQQPGQDCYTPAKVAGFLSPTGQSYLSYSGYIYGNYRQKPDTTTLCEIDRRAFTSSPSQQGAINSNPSPIFNPAAFSSSVSQSIASNGSAVSSEVDKVISNNPGLVSGVPSWSASDTNLAKQSINHELLTQQLADLEASKLSDPANPGLYDPAIVQLKQAIDYNSLPLNAESEDTQISDKLTGIQSTLDEIKNELADQDPDTIYSPSSLGQSYTLPEVDFGARLTDFVDTVKTSSLFSLPNSAFNVPGGNSSQLTINGGETFGVHVFDFADMSSFWAVLKSIVLTGFSFVAVRIVCLKGGSQ